MVLGYGNHALTDEGLPFNCDVQCRQLPIVNGKQSFQHGIQTDITTPTQERIFQVAMERFQMHVGIHWALLPIDEHPLLLSGEVLPIEVSEKAVQLPAPEVTAQSINLSRQRL